MNKKILLAILIFALVLGLTAFIRFQPKGTVSQQTPNAESQGNSQANSQELEDDEFEDEDTVVIPDTTQNPPSTSDKVTSEQLSAHDSKTDCWVAYDGKVYDLTSFLPKHPGSSRAIEPYCGTSEGFKEAFESQHGTSKVSNLMRMGVLIGDFDVIGQTA